LAAPPASGQETGKKKKKKGKTETDATKTAPSAEDSENADTIKTTGSTSLTTPDLASPMISSVDIIPAPDVHRAGTNRRRLSFLTPGATYASKVAASLTAVATDAPKKNEHSESPPSSARIVTGISKSFLGSSPPSSSLADDPKVLQSQPQQQEPDPVRRKHLFEHKVITMPPGAHSIIPEAALTEAVEFLTTQVGQGKKVLVHCRDGNGRSGSVAVAYIASQLERDDKPSHYNEALEEIWKWKCDVYPHKGLKQTLEKIGW
jgi:protein-tyrosine phosphatase